MKKLRKIISCLVLMNAIGISNSHSNVVCAHSAQLEDITYDPCTPVEYVDEDNIGAGENEPWYCFTKYNGLPIHLANNGNNGYDKTTITYNLELVDNNGISWYAMGRTGEEGDALRNAIIDGMKEWNKITFYRTTSGNGVIKAKVTDVVHNYYGHDQNIVVYPIFSQRPSIIMEYNENTITEVLDSEGNVDHYHASQYIMKVPVNYGNGFLLANGFLENSGMRMIAYALGLDNIDISLHNDDTYHHQEALMGGNFNNVGGPRNITYRDIAGIAITRGFHEEGNHRWMLDESYNIANQKKYICMICNGVRYKNKNDNSISYYFTYKKCNNNHTVDSGNMIALASYENKDYYKCKYCRYIAPFKDLVTQDYEYQMFEGYDDHLTKSKNTKMYYSFNEKHDIVKGYCSKCNYHVHEQVFKYYNNRGHRMTCIYCNESFGGIKTHSVLASKLINGRYAPCIVCKEMLDIEVDKATIESKIIYRTENGSYILENGIIVLDDRDLEAYLNDTLKFYKVGEEAI